MRNLLSVTHRCENHQAPPGDENHKSIFFSCASATVLIKKIHLSHDLNISSWNCICVCGQEIEELTKSCPWRSTCVRRPSQQSKSSWKVKVNLVVQRFLENEDFEFPSRIGNPFVAGYCKIQRHKFHHLCEKLAITIIQICLSWLPYSTYPYLDFHLCSMTKLKEHSREIC